MAGRADHHPDPRPGADQPELRRAHPPLARGAGRHLQRRAEPARRPGADPVRRHPVGAPEGLRDPARRPGAGRRGPSDSAQRQHHLPPLPRRSRPDQPAAQDHRPHRDALPPRQRHAARRAGCPVRRHRLRGLGPRADRPGLPRAADQQADLDPARRLGRRHPRRRVHRRAARGGGRPGPDHPGGDRRGRRLRPGPALVAAVLRRASIMPVMSATPSARAASPAPRSSATRPRRSATASSPRSSAARSGRWPRWACSPPASTRRRST